MNKLIQYRSWYFFIISSHCWSVLLFRVFYLKRIYCCVVFLWWVLALYLWIPNIAVFGMNLWDKVEQCHSGGYKLTFVCWNRQFSCCIKQPIRIRNHVGDLQWCGIPWALMNSVFHKSGFSKSTHVTIPLAV